MSTEISSANAALLGTPAAPTARSDAAARIPASSVWRSLAREPLLHFCVIGGLLFGADAWLHPPKRDERTIVVTKALRQSFSDNFDEDKARVPSEAELQKMVDAWVASEILYREGKAMAVDRGDEMIRDRVAYKLQLLIFDQVQVAQATDSQLAAWFEKNHEHFDEPERVGFYLTPPTDEATARRELQEIVTQQESPELRKQTRAILARPVPSIAPAFGEAFGEALLRLPIGEWQVLESKDGWHVVRLDSRRAGKPKSLAEVRDEAARLWHNDEVRKQAWEAVTRLKAQYNVQYEQ